MTRHFFHFTALAHVRHEHAGDRRFGPPSHPSCRPITTPCQRSHISLDRPCPWRILLWIRFMTNTVIRASHCHRSRLACRNHQFRSQKDKTSQMDRAAAPIVSLEHFTSLSARRKRFRARYARRPPTADSGTPRFPAPLLFRNNGQVRGCWSHWHKRVSCFFFFHVVKYCDNGLLGMQAKVEESLDAGMRGLGMQGHERPSIRHVGRVCVCVCVWEEYVEACDSWCLVISSHR